MSIFAKKSSISASKIADILTVNFIGCKVNIVEVQVNISAGLPAFNIVGLPSKAVTESKERIRSAITSLGFSMPAKRITINLSPADTVKNGSHFDLPIALAILQNIGVLESDALEACLIMGELALNGNIIGVRGILPAAIEASSRSLALICPQDNIAEAYWAGKDLELIAGSNLVELIKHLKGEKTLPKIECPEIQEAETDSYPDISEVKGNIVAKRAMEIVAAGGHNLLMRGAPGSGKTMLAQRLMSIMPPMTTADILENSIIASLNGNIDAKKGINNNRPFRSPHYNASIAAMIGGGGNAKAGEITMANNGILFLDELPEFGSKMLDSLRTPMEDKKVTIARANAHIDYPCDFQLIAAMNPCKCGYLNDITRSCKQAPICSHRYQDRISGPILDRIDIYIDVDSPDPFADPSYQNDNSATIRKRVIAAYQMQLKRYGGKIKNNSNLKALDIEEYCKISEKSRQYLQDYRNRYGLNMRSYNQILKVARTIADLAVSAEIQYQHVTEASFYQPRKYEFLA